MFNKSDAGFYDAFVTHATQNVEAVTLLKRTFDDPANAAEYARAIAEIEHAGDAITHAVVRQLHATWITKIERPDIHRLIARLDDVLDDAEAVSDRVALFELTNVAPAARELTDVLLLCCETVLRMTEQLPGMKDRQQLLALCKELGELESRGDAIHRAALAGLFRSGGDPLDVLKWHEVYDALESALDRCADVANVVEGIVLESA